MVQASTPSAGDGRVHLVTGAASGIGAAAVRVLLEQGSRVVAADRAPIEPAQLGSAGKDRLVTVSCDVSREADCQSAVDKALAAFGRLDAVLHFAGIHSNKAWEDAGPDDFAQVLAVNVTGSFLIAKAAATHMRAHGGGAIVLTGSGSVSIGSPGGEGRGGPAYVSSKGAIIGLTRSLARSMGPHGIRVNSVSPGAIETPMTAKYSEMAVKAVGASTIAGRMGKPEEIARVAIFLASDAASYLTGETINVSGGLSFGL